MSNVITWVHDRSLSRLRENFCHPFRVFGCNSWTVTTYSKFVILCTWCTNIVILVLCAWPDTSAEVINNICSAMRWNDSSEDSWLTPYLCMHRARSRHSDRYTLHIPVYKRINISLLSDNGKPSQIRPIIRRSLRKSALMTQFRPS